MAAQSHLGLVQGCRDGGCCSTNWTRAQLECANVQPDTVLQVPIGAVAISTGRGCSAVIGGPVEKGWQGVQGVVDKMWHVRV